MCKKETPPRPADIIRALPDEIWNLEHKDRSRRKKSDPCVGTKDREDPPKLDNK
jgi:hypothetical protein